MFIPGNYQNQSREEADYRAKHFHKISHQPIIAGTSREHIKSKKNASQNFTTGQKSSSTSRFLRNDMNFGKEDHESFSNAVISPIGHAGQELGVHNGAHVSKTQR